MRKALMITVDAGNGSSLFFSVVRPRRREVHCVLGSTDG